MPSFNSYNCAILEQTLVYLIELDLMNYFQKSLKFFCDATGKVQLQLWQYLVLSSLLQHLLELLQEVLTSSMGYPLSGYWMHPCMLSLCLFYFDSFFILLLALPDLSSLALLSWVTSFSHVHSLAICCLITTFYTFSPGYGVHPLRSKFLCIPHLAAQGSSWLEVLS